MLREIYYVQWCRSSNGFNTSFPISFSSNVYSIAGILMRQYENLYERGIRSFSLSAITFFYNDGARVIGIIVIGI